jgi:hypothetical protein
MISKIPEPQDEMGAPFDEPMARAVPGEFDCTRHALALCLDIELAELQFRIGTAHDGADR